MDLSRIRSIAVHLVFSVAIAALFLGCNLSDSVSDEDAGPPVSDAGVDTGADDVSEPDAAPSEDVDVSSDVGEDTGTDTGEPELNACGGEAELFFGGEPSEPGQSCGECDDGTLLCDGGDLLRCADASEPNECGGCQPLPGSEGDACGPCGDGSYVCDGDGGLICENASEKNACGGCDDLEDQPGHNCESENGEGTTGCVGPDEVRCVLPGENACGGDQFLNDIPGTVCGQCDGGVVACDGTGDTECLGAEDGVNACGGCEPLKATPGEECGRCDGTWECDGTSALVCDDADRNACGRCEDLGGNSPGDACGSDAIFVCYEEGLQCTESVTNPCGGTSTLDADPGEPCGECDDGYVVCASLESTACLAAGDSNECGGCQPLVADPGDPCGDGGSWACDGDDDLVCEIPSPDDQHSTITGQSGVLADGQTPSTIEITLRDGSDDPLTNITPRFSASGDGNELFPCTPSNQDGVAHCAMTSIVGQQKELSVTSPLDIVGDTIEFVAELWSADGIVYDVAQTEELIYVVGNFSLVGDPTGAFVPIDADTADAEQPWPRVDDRVYALASDGDGGWFVGGTFSRIDTHDRTRLAHIRNDGTVNPDFAPELSSTVRAIAVDGDRVFVGGNFTEIDGTERERIAALNADDGSVIDNWQADADNTVRDLIIDGDTLFVGGRFDNVGGAAREGLAAIDTDTGSVRDWTADVDQRVFALAIDGQTLYVGGNFDEINGEERSHLGAVHTSTGSTISQFDPPEPGHSVLDMEVGEDRLYIGGLFTSLGNTSVGRVAALDKADGSLDDGWTPDHNSTVRAVALHEDSVVTGGSFRSVDELDRNYISMIDKNDASVTDWNPGASSTIYALDADANTVYAGGAFRFIGAEPRDNAASFSRVDGALTDWNPDISGAVFTLLIDGDKAFLGGTFGDINGENHDGLGAVDRFDGTVDLNWNHALENDGGIIGGAARNIRTFVLDDQQDTLYAGGIFAAINGEEQYSIAAFNRNNGALRDWEAHHDDGGLFGSETNDVFRAAAIADDRIYVGGTFEELGGNTNIDRLGAVYKDDATIDQNFDLEPDGDVDDLLFHDGLLYVAGSFDTIGGEDRTGFAVVDPVEIEVTDWDLELDGSVQPLFIDDDVLYLGGQFDEIAGREYDGLAAIALDADDPLVWHAPPGGADGNVEAIIAAGPTIYVGGHFTFVGDGMMRPHFATIPGPTP